MPYKNLLDARVHCAVLKVREVAPPPPPPDPGHPGGTTGMKPSTEETVARSLRTQQRAYDHPTPSDPVPDPRRGRTRHQTQPAAELVSVPPSSSTTNTRRRSL